MHLKKKKCLFYIKKENKENTEFRTVPFLQYTYDKVPLVPIFLFTLSRSWSVSAARVC